jgi:exodeoxyribonuclease VII large subunit
MNLPVITVSQLNLYIKKMFDSDLRFASVMLSGEISNLSPHYRSGHLYFSLKDDQCSIKAVMFAREASRLRFQPENGMKVIALGRVSVFERDGVYQLYVRELQPDGAGALAVAFEQLKKRLAAEGLFDPALKRPLPPMPRRIGVITSPNGAALQDILNIIGRRYPMCEVIVAGVTVQGNTAASEMIDAIEAFNRRRLADVLILGRGGGSAEDLWCFNDERLARAIRASAIPVISAVGHETDFTISDFAADLRAPTPSAAAELATPDIIELTNRAAALESALCDAYLRGIETRRASLSVLLAKRSFTSPAHFFDADRLCLADLSRRLRAQAEGRFSAEHRRQDRARELLFRRTDAGLSAHKMRLTRDVTALKKLNPLDVLLRGWALAEKDGAVVTDAETLRPGDRLHVTLRNGTAECTVDEITKGNCYGTDEV